MSLGAVFQWSITNPVMYRIICQLSTPLEYTMQSQNWLSNLEHFHNLVSQVVDHLYRNPTGLRLREGPRSVAMKRFPGFLVDFGFEGGLEGFVGIVGAEEICVPDEKALVVVIGIDKPARNIVGIVAPDFTGVGMEYVDAMNGDL